MDRLQSTPAQLITHRVKAVLALMITFSAGSLALGQTPLDNHFTYQGLIKQNGVPFNGSCNFSFSLYAVPASGSALGAAFNTPGIAVVNGLFTAQLEFAANAFNGEKRWLEIQAECPGGSGVLTTLGPRQELTAAPHAAYAVQAGSAATAAGMPWGGLSNVPSGFADGVDNDTQYTAGTGLILSSGQFSVDFGNVQHRVAGCPGGGFIQGIDANGSPTCGNAAAVVHTHNRIEADSNGSLQIVSSGASTTPNIIGGYSGNSITSGVLGGTINGGGTANYIGTPRLHLVTDDYGTVGGGIGNRAGDNNGTTSDRRFATVGGGHLNTASGENATVSGGNGNTANGTNATVGGGTSNQASLFNSTVAGGTGNVASGDTSAVGGGFLNVASGVNSTIGGGMGNAASSYYCTVGGGNGNTASGHSAMVPGGAYNTAGGSFSFAAGRRAKANNAGCFAWGDSTEADVPCNADNQWVARTSGGVYFYTNGSLSSGMYLAAGGSSWNAVSSRSLKENFQPLDHRQLLAHVAQMDIGTWNYRAQDKSIRHVGPVADEFNALVPGLGGEGKNYINSLDADGVALASIQGLYQELKDRDAKIATLETRLKELEQVLRQLAAAQKER